MKKMLTPFALLLSLWIVTIVALSRKSCRSDCSMGYTSKYIELKIKSGAGISFVDITKDISSAVKEANIKEGALTVIARHTTAGIELYEWIKNINYY
jgi:hypothetical protein